MSLPGLHVSSERYFKYRWLPRTRWWIIIESDEPRAIGPFTKFEYAGLSRELLGRLLLEAKYNG
jgi:hypothetical protein